VAALCLAPLGYFVMTPARFEAGTPAILDSLPSTAGPRVTDV
jgi:hypothetical protein